MGTRGCDRDVDPVKVRLARGYSRSAPVYDEMAGQLYLTGFKRLLPHIHRRSWMSILDVGCGTGINLLAAAQILAPARLLCGIDISSGMVETARSKADVAGVPAHFVVGDAERLPYPDSMFDLIICNSILHWFQDRMSAVREMARVLRPGGQVVMICAGVPCFTEWFQLIDFLLPTVGIRSTVRGPSPLPNPAEVATIFAAAGLQVVHLSNPIEVQRVTNPEPFVRLMTTMAPHWASDLSPAQINAIEQLAAKMIRSRFPRGFPNTWSAIEAAASLP